jgi:cytochrome c2
MTMASGRKQFLLWVGAAVVAATGLVIILVLERRPVASARHTFYVVGDAQQGRILFFGEKQCSICHSIKGEGGRIAPDLSQAQPAAPAMGWLATVLWNHAPGMFRRIRGTKAYPQLNSQEMADILAFLYQSAGADPPGDLQAGRIVFEKKGCVRCHSVRASGGKAAPDLSRAASAGANEWTRAMWNHSQSMVRPVTEALGAWPEFIGSNMTDLLAYINEGVAEPPHETAGNTDRGWKVFQARCIQCHTIRRSGGSLGPELGPERDLPLTTTRFASVLWNHAPVMLRLSQEKGIALPQLDGNDMSDLVAFLASLRYYEPAGSPLVGGRTFNERGCSRCHGGSAEGTQLGPRIQAGGEAYTAVSFTAALWKHGPRMVDQCEKLGIAWPTLAPADIGDLVSFLNEPKQ